MKFDATLTVSEIQSLVRCAIEGVKEAPDSNHYALIYSVARAEAVQKASKTEMLSELNKILSMFSELSSDAPYRFNLTMPLHNDVEENLVQSVQKKFQAIQELSKPSKLVGLDEVKKAKG